MANFGFAMLELLAKQQRQAVNLSGGDLRFAGRYATLEVRNILAALVTLEFQLEKALP